MSSVDPDQMQQNVIAIEQTVASMQGLTGVFTLHSLK